jgi:hypothetical protein
VGNDCNSEFWLGAAQALPLAATAKTTSNPTRTNRERPIVFLPGLLLRRCSFIADLLAGENWNAPGRRDWPGAHRPT